VHIANAWVELMRHLGYTRFVAQGGFFTVKGVSIPVGVSVFPDELYRVPRSWAEQAFPNLVHYNELDRGGHFAAWEQPQLFAEEVRATFRSLR
jgi:hypothetical protein